MSPLTAAEQRADVLLIGGSHFVGRGIALGLVADGHRVTLLNRGSRSVPGTQQLVADRHDAAALRRAVGNSQYDWIIDCCCYDAAQARLAYEALGSHCAGWLYLSSAAIYVDDAPVPAPEAGPLGRSAQWGAYGLNKLEAERELAGAADASGATVVALRAPYVYGPGPNPDREPWLWARLLRGRPILMPGAGDTPIQFLHTRDLAHAVARIVQRERRPGFRCFNAAESQWHSIEDYLRTLAEVAGVAPDLRCVPHAALDITPRSFFPFRDTPCVLDVARIRDELGWHARHDLRSGLAQTYEAISGSDLAHAEIDTRAEDAILARLASPP